MSEVTCPKCGGYVPGHATGTGEICTCEPITTGDKFRIAAEKTNALNMELYGQLAQSKADAARFDENLRASDRVLVATQAELSASKADAESLKLRIAELEKQLNERATGS